MTVASEVNRSGPYIGNGVTTIFNYGFKIISEDHLLVIRADSAGNETTLVIDTDYIVSDVGNDSGGAVALLVAPAAGQTITILRNVPIVQETDLENQGAYYAETIEAALDLAAMRDQQLAEKLSRAVLVPASEDDTGGDLAGVLSRGIIRLAGSADNIDTVADNVSDVNAVADAIPDVETVAQNIEAINAASGSVLSLLDQSYVAAAGQTLFVLPAPASAENVMVWVGGVRQVPGVDYSVSGTGLSLVPAPGSGVSVDVLVITAVSMEDVRALRDQALEAADRVDLGDLDAAVAAAVLNKDQAEDARDAAVVAQGLSDTARAGSDLARIASEVARAGSEAALDAVTLAALVKSAARASTIAAAITSARGAVTDGQTFAATGDDVDYMGLYLRTSSSAQTEIDNLPKSATVEAIRQARSLQFAQPNLVSARADRIQSFIDFGGLGTSTLAAVVVGGMPAWRLSVTGTNAARYRVPRSRISGAVVSASVYLLALSAAGAGATSTNSRVMLLQLRANNTEISAARQAVTLTDPTSAALPGPRRVAFNNVALDAECDSVEFWVEAQNTGGATVRTVDFRELHISAGPSSVYREPSDAFTIDASDQIQARADWAWTENQWPDPELDDAGASVSWGVYALPVVTVNGRRALRSPASAPAIAVEAPALSLAGNSSGRISVSAVIEGKPATAAGALRFRLFARDAGGNILPWVDQTRSDFLTDANVYTRFVPEEAISTPKTLVVAQNIALPAGAATLHVSLRVETVEQMDFNKICVREGSDPSYKKTPVVPVDALVANSVSEPVEEYLPGAFGAQNATRTLSVVTDGGQKKHRITFNPGSTALAFMGLPRGNVLNLDAGFLSFSARVSASAGNGSTGNTRVLFTFRLGDTEVVAVRQTFSFNTNGGALAETLVSFAGVAVPSDPWDNIRVIWDAQPGNGTAARTMDVWDVMLTGDISSSYRPRGPESLGAVPKVSGFTILPDVPGGAPTGGGTCTGLDKVGSGPFAGCMIIGIDGRTVEGDGSPFAARAIIVSPDFARLLASYDLASPTSDGVQGVAWDSSDGSFWVARPGLKRIEHYSGAGAEITADRISLAGWAGAWDTPNGLAYDAATNSLYVCSASSATVYRVTKAGAISATRTIGTATPDQLCLYDGKLYISVGANGVNGDVHAHDLATGANSVPFVQLPFAQAIEGIWRDAETLAFVNDGGFHIVASPALNFGAIANISAAA